LPWSTLSIVGHRLESTMLLLFFILNISWIFIWLF
jgi:hypothetical protein